MSVEVPNAVQQIPISEAQPAYSTPEKTIFADARANSAAIFA